MKIVSLNSKGYPSLYPVRECSKGKLPCNGIDSICRIWILYIILCQSIYKNVNIGCQINTNMKFDYLLVKFDDLLMKFDDLLMKFDDVCIIFDDEAIDEIDGQDTISL